jgi:hypothetical protein
MHLLDWNQLSKSFYLLDTFAGIDERFVSQEEKDKGILTKNAEQLKSGFYTSRADSVRANFSQWQRVKIIEGAIPETLDKVDSQDIAYLHIDLNCSPPEVAALRYFWARVVPGGLILLDDYAYVGYELQKAAMDTVARDLGFSILSLPTGQGLILKSKAAD